MLENKFALVRRLRCSVAVASDEIFRISNILERDAIVHYFFSFRLCEIYNLKMHFVLKKTVSEQT